MRLDLSPISLSFISLPLCKALLNHRLSFSLLNFILLCCCVGYRLQCVKSVTCVVYHKSLWGPKQNLHNPLKSGKIMSSSDKAISLKGSALAMFNRYAQISWKFSEEPVKRSSYRKAFRKFIFSMFQYIVDQIETLQMSISKSEYEWIALIE